MDSNIPAKAWIIATLMERGSFMHRNDLLLESEDYRDDDYGVQKGAGSGRAQVTGLRELAVESLVEDGVLQQLDSAELLEEVIRAGRYINDDYPEMKVSELEDADEGGYFVVFGPRLPFFVADNFAELVEFSEENDFDRLKDYSFEIAAVNEPSTPASDRFVSRQDNSAAFEEIDAELERLERRLSTDNAVTKALADDRDIAILEVGILRRLVNAGKVRASVLVAMSKKTLGWIADKCAGAAVAEVAKHVLLQILRLFS